MTGVAPVAAPATCGRSRPDPPSRYGHGVSGPPPVAAIVSFRLGADDGVSVQAATWARVIEGLGFTVRRVAGGLADVCGIRA